MPVIDVHAHIYPDKIAAKAVAAVGKFYDYEEMSGGGTPDDLLEIVSPSPITRCIVHSVATTAKSVARHPAASTAQNKVVPPEDSSAFGAPSHLAEPDKYRGRARAFVGHPRV